MEERFNIKTLEHHNTPGGGLASRRKLEMERKRQTDDKSLVNNNTESYFLKASAFVLPVEAEWRAPRTRRIVLVKCGNSVSGSHKRWY